MENIKTQFKILIKTTIKALADNRTVQQEDGNFSKTKHGTILKPKYYHGIHSFTRSCKRNTIKHKTHTHTPVLFVLLYSFCLNRFDTIFSGTKNI